MKIVGELLEIVNGDQTKAEAEGPARRLRLCLAALLGAALCGALYGLVVSSTDLGLAAANLYKVPMIIVLSAVSALPAGLLTLKLSRAPLRTSDLLLSAAAAQFTGALVLAAGAPLAGLFYHTSVRLGAPSSLLIAGLALGASVWILVRAALNRRPHDARRRAVLFPALIFATVQILALLQLTALASPILPETTPFAAGAEGLLSSARHGGAP